MEKAGNSVLDKRLPAFCCLLLLCTLVPWAYVHFLGVPNGDVIWLTEALRRYLHGDSLISGIYEPNPPLALFTTAPQLLLTWLTGIPLGPSIVIATSAFVFLSAFAIERIVRPWPFLQADERWSLICVYILANTILVGPMLGERDHLLALGLVPFVLMQASLTFGLPYNKKLAACVFFIGAWLILLKPHHGLLVTLILLHRPFYQRRMAGLFGMDFIMLALATLMYVAGTWVLFPEFVHYLLPEDLIFYMATTDISVTYNLMLQYLAAAGVLLGCILFQPLGNAGRKHMAIGMTLCGLVALIPFVLQGRGYYYHLIPAMIFLWLSLHLHLQSVLKNYTSRRGALVCGLIFMTILTYRVANDPMHPTEREYAAQPLVKEVAECGHPACSFFFFAPGLEMVHEIAYSANTFHASRFPSYWFLPYLVTEKDKLDHGKPASLTREQLNQYNNRFTSMVAGDFLRYRPSVVLLTHFKILADGPPFDFVPYFSVDKDFKTLWQAYKKEKTMTIRLGDYIPGLTTNQDLLLDVDIYRLKKGDVLHSTVNRTGNDVSH